MTITSTTLVCDDCGTDIMNERDAETARLVAIAECGALCDDNGDHCKTCAEKLARAEKGRTL